MASARRFGDPGHSPLVTDLSSLLEFARRGAARTVNAVITATYRETGRRILKFEQAGAERAEYGAGPLQPLVRLLRRRQCLRPL